MGRKIKGIKDKKLLKIIKNLSKNLRKVRAAKGFTLQKLASLANIATSTLWELENERVEDFRISTLINIAHQLDVDPLDLLD